MKTFITCPPDLPCKPNTGFYVYRSGHSVFPFFASVVQTIQAMTASSRCRKQLTAGDRKAAAALLPALPRGGGCWRVLHRSKERQLPPGQAAPCQQAPAISALHAPFPISWSSHKSLFPEILALLSSFSLSPNASPWRSMLTPLHFVLHEMTFACDSASMI